MAWELLTTVYKIPPSRLYITYFGGDDHLGLPCDIETRDIWKSLGVPNNRLLPFKAKDNFWEMGITGPCGPCTEIHFDHMGVINRHEFVNKNLHDLTEIWNLVFIQFNRLPDGSIVPLPRNHVDTGLGLERLCCALQGKLSTYNTDLFDYLIKAIHKNCSEIQKYSGKFGEQDWNEIDTSYRILADHIRMLTVCLADGVIPEQNQKLKRVLRKCFILCETVFKKDGTLVKELSNYVVENLGGVYPELERNISQIHNIIDYELEVFNTIRTTAKKDWRKFSIGRNLPNIDSLDITPSFVKAYKELYDVKLNEIDGELAYRLYDTHGFDLEAIEQLAQILNVKFDAVTFETKMEEVKLNSRAKRQLFIDDKIANLLGEGFEKTDDSFKYSYSKNKDKYQFPEVECKVLQIYNKDQSLTEIKTGSSCSLILDKTNLYFEAGGQESDKGQIKFEDGLFEVETLKKFKNYVIHKGYVKEGSIKVNTQGSLRVNEHIRLSNMRNHTCAHLLNAAVKKIRSATCQKSNIIAVEKLIRDIIKENLSVRILITDSQGLYSYDQITLIPGDVYPDNDIRIVEIEQGSDFVSREPCCGTHVLNTSDLQDFCVINLKSLGRSTASIQGVTGDRAKLARDNAEDLNEDLIRFKKSVEEHLDKPEMLEMAIISLKQRLNFQITDNTILPYAYKLKIMEELNAISRDIKGKTSDQLRDLVEMEMQDAIESNMQLTKSKKKYIIYYLRISTMLESVSLKRATALCSNIPVIVIAYSDNMVKARCCVPKVIL
ncbi:hypothetical protein ABEB36_003655 [Hypothenemus hampei]|uniref:Alanine--tRNA ligase n=1 Tax=Hypothenemus hampei TaxID=57062 RepID=A0ABD1F9X6_HYPHA